MNRQQLSSKLSSVTAELLREKGYISFVDVFMKLGYLDPADYESWRRKRVPFVERVIKVNLSKINFIIKTVRRNSQKEKLRPSWAAYRSWGKGPKVRLRFSKSGKNAIERTYATHFVTRSKKAERRPLGESPKRVLPSA